MNSTTAPAAGDDPDEAFDEHIRQVLHGAAETYAQRAHLGERLQETLETSTGAAPGLEEPGSGNTPEPATGPEAQTPHARPAHGRG